MVQKFLRSVIFRFRRCTHRIIQLLIPYQNLTFTIFLYVVGIFHMLILCLSELVTQYDSNFDYKNFCLKSDSSICIEKICGCTDEFRYDLCLLLFTIQIISLVSSIPLAFLIDDMVRDDIFMKGRFLLLYVHTDHWIIIGFALLFLVNIIYIIFNVNVVLC